MDKIFFILFLIFRFHSLSNEKIVITRSWCTDKDDNHGGGAIAIPKGWVNKIEYLGVQYAERNNDS